MGHSHMIYSTESNPIKPSEGCLRDDETLDGISGREVLLIQRQRGYRFSIDALLLADFAGTPRGQVVDLGAGCGVIPLLLATRGTESIVGVELQSSLFELACRNVALNRRQEQISVVNADLRCLKGVLKPGSFDLVLSNPPYVPVRAGFVNPVSEKAIARHEIACSPADLAQSARYLLREGGSFKLIFPASRLVELVTALTAAGLTPVKTRFVHTLPTRPAKMLLLEASKGSGKVLKVLPPVYLFDEAGVPLKTASFLE